MAVDNLPNANPNSLLNKVVPVPTLSTLGFIYDSTNKFDKLLSHAFVADYNQTYLYPGKITSVPRFFELAGNNIVELEDTLKTNLYTYFNKYYESVDLSVSISPYPTDDTKITLELSITVTENGIPQSFTRNHVTPLKTFSNIIKLNNYGG